MSYDQSLAPLIGTCVGCLEVREKSQLIWKPLVSVETGLYYPGEPFCRESCYDRWTNRDDAKFRQPTDEQKVAFRRSVSPIIPQIASVPFTVKRKETKCELSSSSQSALTT